MRKNRVNQIRKKKNINKKKRFLLDLDAITNNNRKDCNDKTLECVHHLWI